MTCCFSGYRIEKMAVPERGLSRCARAVRRTRCCGRRGRAGRLYAFSLRYVHRLCLWAAEAVLRSAAPHSGAAAVCCAVRRTGRSVSARVEAPGSTAACSPQIRCTRSRGAITPGALPRATGLWWMHRQGSSVTMMGRSGGTAQTVHMAEQSGLKIVNLADGTAVAAVKRTDRWISPFVFGLTRAEWKIENGEWRMDVMVWFSEPSCYGARYSSSPI